jgi:YgiT-type zinc finger domain-containing protein
MYCKCQDLIPALTTHVVNYKGCIIIVKNVPCEECEQCGEKYYSDEVARQLEQIVNTAKQLMQEISVIDYSKAA